MRKRKIAGILMYGKRTYASNGTQKFQSGGVSAFGAGYDWRDDPYELMLLEQKAREKNARITASSRKKSGTTKPPKIEGFTALTGGLKSSRDAANAEFQQDQQAYYGAIKQNGIEWLSTPDAQIMHQAIVNKGIMLESSLKSEKEEFDIADKSITDEDRQVYAISSLGNVMVQRKSEETGRSEVAKVTLEDYANNTDKYQIMKIGDVSTWKRNYDYSRDNSIVQEFMQSGALGENTVFDRYFKGKKDYLQYSIDRTKGQIHLNDGKMATGKMDGDTGVWSRGLDNIMKGADFYSGDLKDLKDTNSSTEIAVRKAADSLFNDVMSSAADRSILVASLRAEFLANNKSKAYLNTLETPKERMQFIDIGIKALLVSKILDAPKKKSGSDSEGGGGTGEVTFKANANLGVANYMAFTKGNNIEQYTIGDEIDVDGETRVIDINMPMVRGAISTGALNIVKDPKATITDKKQNKLLSNSILDEQGDTSTIFSEKGQDFKKLLGSSTDVSTYFGDHTSLDPNKPVHMALIPFSNGEFVHGKAKGLAKVKMKSREDFIKVMSTHGDKITTPASDLLPGNLNPTAQNDYKKYQDWVQSGNAATVEKYREEAKGGGEKANNRFIRAKAAVETIKAAEIYITSIFGNKPVSLEPVFIVGIIGDGRKFGIKDKLGELVKDTTDKEEEFLEDTNGVDTGWFNDPVKFNVFIRANDIGRIAAIKGEKIGEVAQLQKYNEAWKEGINDMTSFSKVTLSNTAMLLVQ